MDNDYHKEYWPSFGIREPQSTMCVLTVFAVGGSGRDCAAYRGVVPADKFDTPEWKALVQEVRRGGNKISEEEARTLFDFGDLVWRR